MRLELRLTAETPVGPSRTLPAFCLVRLAVAVGFEPTEACTSHAFEACSFGRSDTLPTMSLLEPSQRDEPHHLGIVIADLSANSALMCTTSYCGNRIEREVRAWSRVWELAW